MDLSYSDSDDDTRPPVSVPPSSLPQGGGSASQMASSSTPPLVGFVNYAPNTTFYAAGPSGTSSVPSVANSITTLTATSVVFSTPVQSSPGLLPSAPGSQRLGIIGMAMQAANIPMAQGPSSAPVSSAGLVFPNLPGQVPQSGPGVFASPAASLPTPAPVPQVSNPAVTSSAPATYNSPVSMVFPSSSGAMGPTLPQHFPPQPDLQKLRDLRAPQVPTVPDLSPEAVELLKLVARPMGLDDIAHWDDDPWIPQFIETFPRPENSPVGPVAIPNDYMRFFEKGRKRIRSKTDAVYNINESTVLTDSDWVKFMQLLEATMYSVAPFVARPINPADPEYTERVQDQERAQLGMEGLGMAWQLAHVFRRRAFRFTYRGSFRFAGLSFKAPNIFGPFIFNGKDKPEVLKELEEERELYKKIKTSERSQNGFVKTTDDGGKPKKQGSKQAWKRNAQGQIVYNHSPYIPQSPMNLPLPQFAMSQQPVQFQGQQQASGSGLLGAAPAQQQQQPASQQQAFLVPAPLYWTNRPHFPGKRSGRGRGGFRGNRGRN